MQIHFHSDKTIEGSERLHNYLTTELESALARFDEKITRVEVQLGDVNGEKFDLNDKRCMIEAKLTSLQPLAVTHFADTTDKAFSGAVDKLKRVLNTTFEKMRNH